jgi:hypothetical protein
MCSIFVVVYKLQLWIELVVYFYWKHQWEIQHLNLFLKMYVIGTYLDHKISMLVFILYIIKQVNKFVCLILNMIKIDRMKCLHLIPY